MKILLLGANGQLGRAFMEDGGLAAHGTLVPATRDGTLWNDERGEVADLAGPDLERLLERIHPDVIVNAAAYTAVDRAEQDEALATRVNGDAVGVLAAWAAAHGALVLHYSTDYVFGGDATTPYPVDAPTGPLGAYGRSKLAGEEALRTSGADHLILRTAWVYAPHGHNFLRTMLRLGAERDELRVVADQYGAPTSTALIVRASVALLERWFAEPGARDPLRGTHHVVASGHTSWHGFASAIFDEAHARGLLARKPRVLPIATTDYPTLARRPAWSVLDNTGLGRLLGSPLPDWQEGLHEVMDRLADRVA
ncbi:dTDP-4-dehydrorhamnose reductase [Frateuria sp. STR12]|uniref:dTDP-4-dehydrorhamnose reductase n=1 Tax=Frateuria hangzhouensis TaxID=2995589 RepID=UPI002260A2B8|nr:dTDP-4-dehydrorhamnose reductase [Frateuria sp. STR12]MCX7512880.1 dTDP-4-dehydrorhamnose reductase [Frateuria sp. STR12]